MQTRCMGVRTLLPVKAEDMRDAPSGHMDETRLRINGMSSWMWTFVEKWAIIFVFRYFRGHDVPLQMLGKHAPGMSITDRLRACETLASERRYRQLHGWIYMLLDAKGLSEFYADDGV